MNPFDSYKRLLTVWFADLDEFYAMVTFVSPGLLGDAKAFRLLYADSIVRSRDKTSSEDQRRIGQKRLAQMLLSTIQQHSTDLAVGFCNVQLRRIE